MLGELLGVGKVREPDGLCVAKGTRGNRGGVYISRVKLGLSSCTGLRMDFFLFLLFHFCDS